ncbi:MAG: hypothetical protein LBR41_02135 [Rickettsiales bacterium]|jgi:hypothetical protein|nr:hypothetical protein [Rickettsiales bacterium]
MIKKALIIFLITMGMANSANWWEMVTICMPSRDKCYATMMTGYDAGMWDADSKCFGMKMVCGNALRVADDAPVAMSKSAIATSSNFNSDFDIGVLSGMGKCWGARKTQSNGTRAMVNGKYENVWCAGVLDNPDERTENGFIKFGAQPTCTQLAENGWVAVLDSKCYGRKFDPREYAIECGRGDLPTRIVALNGARDFDVAGTSQTQSVMDRIFREMRAAAAALRNK